MEVMIALCIASFLLAILFPYLKETTKIKKILEEEKKIVFSKNYLQSRLAKLLATIQLHEDKFFEIGKKYVRKNLCFYFKSDLKKEFKESLKAEIFLKNNCLILNISNYEDKINQEECLLTSVEDIDFVFCYADHGKVIKMKNQYKEKNLPFFLILEIKFLTNKEDSFFFRLYPTNRLYDTRIIP